MIFPASPTYLWIGWANDDQRYKTHTKRFDYFAGEQGKCKHFIKQFQFSTFPTGNNVSYYPVNISGDTEIFIRANGKTSK